ncbi:MAG: response regulator [Planctomycetes bacterium]|nr:response regulator [Planctomycetota bacterium]
MRNTKPILLVEDDRIDAMTVTRALKDLMVTNQLVHTVNGEEALHYLRNQSNRKPCVILLDLNLPKLNGLEFLRIAKAEDQLKKIPVVALTTSKEAPDIDKCFELGIAGYIVKPVDYEKFVEAIRVLELYWTLSELPNGE